MTKEPIKVLLENKDVLSFSVSRGCLYDKDAKRWIFGCIGSQGAAPVIGDTGSPPIKQPIKRPLYIDAFIFYVRIPKEDFKLHDRLFSALTEFQKDKNDDVILEENKPIHYFKKRSKSEYRVKADEIEQINAQRQLEYNLLCDKLEALGCCTDDLGGPKMENNSVTPVRSYPARLVSPL
jgi:hypothetical protein